MANVSTIKTNVSSKNSLNVSNLGNKKTVKLEKINNSVVSPNSVGNPFLSFNSITDGISAGPLGGFKEVDINDYSAEDSESFAWSVLTSLPENKDITILMNGKKYKLTRADLEDYLKNNTRKDSETGAQKQITLKNFLYQKNPNWYFSLFNNTYGCNQRGIQSLFVYELNGKKYTYSEYREYCNKCKKKGIAIPQFKQIPNSDDYFRFQKKLMKKGFSKKNADVVLKIMNRGPGICTYSSVVNTIIAAYIGREEEFKQKFGFPMYIEKNGKKELNANELLVDLYVFVNSEENGGFMFSKDHKPFFDTNRSDYGDSIEQMYLRTTDLVQDENGNLKVIKTAPSLLTKYLKVHNIDYECSCVYESMKQKANDKQFDKLISELKSDMEKGITFDIGISDVKGYDSIHMYNTTPSGEDFCSNQMNGGAHSMYITKIDKDCLYVSSWGEEYKIPFSDLKNNSYYEIYSSKIS